MPDNLRLLRVNRVANKEYMFKYQNSEKITQKVTHRKFDVCKTLQ
jgi:hypothetical protein